MLSHFFFLLLHENNKKMKRESNFELLRTLAMFFIVIYHCLTHGVGGEYVFTTAQIVSLSNLLFSDFMLVFSSIAVNLYVMISGYFLVDLDFKLSRIVRTWTYAMFYSCVITVLFVALNFVPFDIVSIGKSFFPLSTDAYWFVTQFIGLLILSPFLAMMVRQLSCRQYMILLIGGAFICLSIIPDLPLGKRFYVAHGNSVWSFAYLFLVAGFIKHHVKKLSTNLLLVSVSFVTLCTLICEVVLGYQNEYVHLYWLNYNGLPFVLTVVVFLLVRQLQVPDNSFWNVLVRLSPYTFGIYLIHDHLLVRDWIWSTIPLSSCCDDWSFLLIVIGLCIGIFLIGALIDSIRKYIFVVSKIDKLINKVDRWSFYS